MIIVKNTRELEEKYDLNQIPDDEPIRVIGGMADKPKYNEEKYQRRTTYSARQIKQIIQQMKAIENKIPEDWNEWQRAKYIYETIASNVGYNYDKESYKTQQSSNLTILLSRKGICAGYALTFKEMMDRQGIECDYVRGDALDDEGKAEKHAWNVLTIDGISIPVDVTWDSGRKQVGEKQLKYFGNDLNFLKEHIWDSDEKLHQVSFISNEDVNSIDIGKTRKEEKSLEDKRNALKLAIEKTYTKFSKQYGEESGYKQASEAIRKFIKEYNLDYFTREGSARQTLEQCVSQEDMLKIIIDDYVQQNVSQAKQPQNFLEHALRQSSDKYGYPQAMKALESYIIDGNTRIFYKK